MVSVLHMVCCLYVFFPLAFLFPLLLHLLLQPLLTRMLIQKLLWLKESFWTYAILKSTKIRRNGLVLFPVLFLTYTVLCVFVPNFLFPFISLEPIRCVLGLKSLCHKIYHISPLKSVFYIHSNINTFCNN